MKGSDTIFPQINKRETGINLRKIMDERNITVKQVQQYLKLGSIQSVYHWLNGLSMPTVDNLYALSQLFDLPIDALVCGNRLSSASEIIYVKDKVFLKRIHLYYTKLNKKYVA